MPDRVQDEPIETRTTAEAGAPPGAPARSGGPADGGGAASEAGSQQRAEPPSVDAEDHARWLEEEHARVVKERDDYLDALQRLKAEFDNFRRRTERERIASAASAGRDVLKDLLPVLDNLERAVQALAGQDDAIVAGVDIVRGQLANLLAGRGLTEIEAHERLPFDPTVHEAVVSSHSADIEEGAVVAVIEKGYRLHDQVLRPAKVVVSAGAAG